jgi:hypothetical protein
MMPVRWSFSIGWMFGSSSIISSGISVCSSDRMGDYMMTECRRYQIVKVIRYKK